MEVESEYRRLADLLRMVAETADLLRHRCDSGDREVREVGQDIRALADRLQKLAGTTLKAAINN